MGLEIFTTGTTLNPNLHIYEIWKVCSLRDGEEMAACTEKRTLSHLNPLHTFTKYDYYPLKQGSSTFRKMRATLTISMMPAGH